ncbi:MAG: TrkA family potassium uptake protein [Candidatus Rokubacteria bacterium]|nr:TrkA family potassium uptake protein [Candidatus Rokubacteria bacterium]
MKHFLVVGLGRFGRAVAEGLAEAGGDVIAIDTDMALVEAVRDRVSVAAQVDSVEPEALRALNATEVDAAVVAIGEDFAAEVLTIAILKELGIETIVARATTERERRILELVGATRVISVEAETGQRLARSLVATDVIDLVALGGGVSVAYWTADERALGKKLADLDLLTRFQLHVLAVRPAGTARLDLFPATDYVVSAGDVLLLIGADARLAAFTR